MSKLVIIDGNAILHRAYHALPPLTTKKGEPINAVYGFVSMLLRVIQDLKPTHITVCFDRKEPTFRHKAFKAYQAHRPAMEKELSGQFEKAKKTIKSFDVPIYEKAGYEADDLIGTIAVQSTRVKESKSKSKKPPALQLSSSSNSIDKIIIVTGDKDILQLVTDKVRVYLPKRGLSDAQLMGEKEVVAQLGIEPVQVVDYKALVGDPSDNYPGVFGIGPKTAENLLDEYGTYKSVYKNINKISETIAKKLKKGKEGGDVSYKLAKIITNVPMKFEINKMSNWSVGNKKTIELFKSFGFKTLTKRTEKIGAQIEEEKQEKLF
jgi:DNA polymerase-1